MIDTDFVHITRRLAASEISTIVQPIFQHHQQTPTSLAHSSCHTNIQKSQQK